ncbi:hypothetical protein QBC41DRAFT_336984 [Cercophora samala]|uniref:Uncharacterized protein n=1 Tax=Cercophora samala TaxID=330535 RepID=A0AA39ZE54_9PEZI|nr:hypothetical protein QBC41DRAFT_336984 [Cercophora samala]
MKHTIALIALAGLASAARIPKPTFGKTTPESTKSNNAGGLLGKIAGGIGGIASGGILLGIEDAAGRVKDKIFGSGEDEAAQGQEAVVTEQQEQPVTDNQAEVVADDQAEAPVQKRDLLSLAALVKLLQDKGLLPDTDLNLTQENSNTNVDGTEADKVSTQEELGDGVNPTLIRARDPRFGRTGRPSSGGQGVNKPAGGSSIGSSAKGFAGTVAGGVTTGGILLGLEQVINGGDQASEATSPSPAETSEQPVAA